MPINTGLAPSLEGCQGCHKGVMGDPPLPSLNKKGVMSLGLGLRLSLSFRNSLENFLQTMAV